MLHSYYDTMVKRLCGAIRVLYSLEQLMKKFQCSLTFYSVLHFLVDLSCAWLMLHRISDADQWYTALFFYNFFAFALQMPLGILTDFLKRDSWFAALGCFLTSLSLLPMQPAPAAVLLAGCGNALFHIGGGTIILKSQKETCTASGIFVSTGALGLFIGGNVLSGTPAISILLMILLLLPLPGLMHSHNELCGNLPQTIPTDDFCPFPALVCLFLVVGLRSYQGMILSFPWNTSLFTGSLMISAVALGKSLGGICADRFGTIRPSFLSLLAAACLFLFPSNIVTGIAAVLFFNMTMPITLTALYRLMPKHPGFSFGLLTFALFLGFLPVYLGIIPSRSSPVLYALLSLISMLLLGVGLKGGDSLF